MVAAPANTPSPTTSGPGSTAATPTRATGAPAASTPATPGTTRDETAQWCAVAVELHDLTTAFRALDADNRGAVEMSLVAILERLDAIAPLTPPALTDDLAVSAEAFALLDAALAEVDYDLAAADLTELDARTTAISAANERIRAYNAGECGIDVGVTGADPP